MPSVSKRVSPGAPPAPTASAARAWPVGSWSARRGVPSASQPSVAPVRPLSVPEDEAIGLDRAAGGGRAPRAGRTLAEQEQGGDRDPRPESHALPAAALALEPIQPGGEGFRSGERHRDLPRPRAPRPERPRGRHDSGRDATRRPRAPPSVERRAVPRPGLERLEARRGPQDVGVAMPRPDDLEPDRQALPREAARHVAAGRPVRLKGYMNGTRSKIECAGCRRSAQALERRRVGGPGHRPASGASAEVVALHERLADLLVEGRPRPAGAFWSSIAESRPASRIIRISVGSIHSGRSRGAVDVPGAHVRPSR